MAATSAGWSGSSRAARLTTPSHNTSPHTARRAPTKAPRSEFLTELNEGGDTLPGVEYTVIETMYDVIVTPYQSAFLDGPNVAQLHLAGHLPAGLFRAPRHGFRPDRATPGQECARPRDRPPPHLHPGARRRRPRIVSSGARPDRIGTRASDRCSRNAVGRRGEGRNSPTSSPKRCRWWCATRAVTTPATPSWSTARSTPSGSCPVACCIPTPLPLIGNGVVVDPAVLLDEIDRLTARGIDCSRLRISGNAHLIMPYHQEIDASDRASSRQEQARHHQVRHRPCLRRQGVTRRAARAGSHRPEDLPREARSRAQREEPDPRQDLQPAAAVDRRAVQEVPRRVRAADRSDDRRLGVAGARSARARREHLARRRPGHLPRSRPRHLSVRHVVEPGGGRRLHRRGRRATRHQPHRRHRQALHHPRRRRTVPDRDPRRTSRRPHRARRRVRHQHRSPPPRRLVRRRDDAPGRPAQLA